MKRLVSLVCVAISLLAACSSPAAELRGAWLTAWTPAYYTAEQIDETIAAAKKAGLNALFIQVRKNADSYYDSKIEARAAEIAPDFDPLAYMINKAHAQGIQVHAWVNAFRVWTAPTAPKDPNHIVNLHPDWLNKDNKGNTRGTEGIYLDPGVPAACEHVAKVMLDIAKRYDIDGIQWDYIRYPGSAFGYSDIALARYRQDTKTTGTPEPKDPRWMQWKRDQVTALVKSVHDQIRAIKPKLPISASTIVWGNCPVDFTMSDAYAEVCQDWKGWVKDGILDANIPMTYKSEGNEKSAKSFRDWLVGFNKWSGGKSVWVGIDVGSSDNAGILAQIEATRKAGLQGYVLFAFNQSKRRASLVEDMAKAAEAAKSSASK